MNPSWLRKLHRVEMHAFNNQDWRAYMTWVGLGGERGMHTFLQYAVIDNYKDFVGDWLEPEDWEEDWKSHASPKFAPCTVKTEEGLIINDPDKAQRTQGGLFGIEGVRPQTDSIKGKGTLTSRTCRVCRRFLPVHQFSGKRSIIREVCRKCDNHQRVLRRVARRGGGSQ